MPPGSHIILIGLRGSGKSTVGAMLARRLRRPWVDLDNETAKALGCSTVAEAWGAAGEAGFRKAELAALRSVLARVKSPTVIALGGGTPTAQGVVGELEKARTGLTIIYLRAPAEVLVARLKGADNSGRPPLTGPGADIFAEMGAVLAERDVLYQRIANHVLETGGVSAERVADGAMALCKGS